MHKLLCIDPLPDSRALISRLAAERNVTVRFCANEEEVIASLGEEVAYAMLIVGDGPSQVNGTRVVQNAKLSASVALLPVAFLLTERDLSLANEALRAGATEVFCRTDVVGIGKFIDECMQPDRGAFLAGRVLVVEDSPSQAAYVEGLCRALGLSVDHSVSAEQGIERVQQTYYQLAIIDVVLVGMQSGLALVRHIRQLPSSRSRMPILVMSGFDDVARRIEALRSGADDYLNKPFIDEEFVWRLHRMMQSRVEYDASIGDASARNGLGNWQQRGLSVRESEVCDALIRGDSDKDIAVALGISYWTVRTHIRSIFTKLGVLNRRELMARFLAGPNQ